MFRRQKIRSRKPDSMLGKCQVANLKTAEAGPSFSSRPRFFELKVDGVLEGLAWFWDVLGWFLGVLDGF